MKTVTKGRNGTPIESKPRVIELQVTDDEHRLIQAGAWLFWDGDVTGYLKAAILTRMEMDFDEVGKHTKAMLGGIER